MSQVPRLKPHFEVLFHNQSPTHFTRMTYDDSDLRSSQIYRNKPLSSLIQNIQSLKYIRKPILGERRPFLLLKLSLVITHNSHRYGSNLFLFNHSGLVIDVLTPSQANMVKRNPKPVSESRKPKSASRPREDLTPEQMIWRCQQAAEEKKTAQEVLKQDDADKAKDEEQVADDNAEDEGNWDHGVQRTRCPSNVRIRLSKKNISDIEFKR